ncbi:MAG TPA: hypothetical protein VK928_04425 [Longimicrobiales bacterium]|nr:hypothetical protein [Longimicrobiales bacterium]
MRTLLLAMALLLMPALAQAQQTPEQRRAAMDARRDSLEAEVLQKFMERLDKDLKLDAEQHVQVERALREGSVRRHELLRASSELRGRMFRALRNTATPEADFARLLADNEALRQREHALWDQDQQALARILTPRQRVGFLLSWSHFQESMREILSRSRDSGRRHP